MRKQVIHSPDAPKAIGPYSQAIRIGDFVFLSGQVALDPATGELVRGGIAAETRRVLENLQAVLHAAGASFSEVVRSTVYLTNLAEFAQVNAIYGEYFAAEPPARVTVQVAALPRGAVVEIDMIAHVGA